MAGRLAEPHGVAASGRAAKQAPSRAAILTAPTLASGQGVSQRDEKKPHGQPEAAQKDRNQQMQNIVNVGLV